MFGYTVPSGFGHDLAGVVDEVGEEIEGFSIGDRVYGGAHGRAVAEAAAVSECSRCSWRTSQAPP